MLAEKAGVELKRENPAEYKFSGLLYELNDAAAKYFRRALAAAPAGSPQKNVPQEYLASRGLTPETVNDFEIGWAPNEPEGLSMYLLNAGTAPQDLIQAGLSIKTERGLMLDRFRGRIMFPIHNHLGKVVGFTGRILPQIEKMMLATAAAAPGGNGFIPAKYVNSPETPIFQKSRLLYGFWKSKDAIRESKTAFLVEGQMDFLMTWQSGVRNVIASSGTALTADHLRSVHRLAENLIVSFDNDAAGSDAAERAIDLAEAQDFSVKVATFASLTSADGVVGKFKDAAEAAQADPENIRRVVASAVPAPEFYFEKYLPAVNPATGAARDSGALATREGLHQLRAVLLKLKNISSPVEQGYWFHKLSERSGVPEETLKAEAERANVITIPNAASRGEASGDGADTPRRQVSRHELICEELFAATISKEDFTVLDSCAEFLNPNQREILRILKSGKRQSQDPGLDTVIGIVTLRSPSPGEVSDEHVAALKLELAKEYYKERRKIVTQAIKNAEARGNEAELKAALEELRGLPVGNGD